MKITTLLIALTALGTSVYAGPLAPAPTTPMQPTEQLFGPGWEFGGHALFLTPEAGRADDAWGGGVDVDYFFNAFVGLEGSAAWARPHSSSTSEANATWGNYTLNLVLRAPVEAYHIAPYLLVGGGMISAKGDESGDRINKWLGQAGVGLEYKPTSNVGLFADWIYNFPGASGQVPDYQLIRMGLKFGF